MQIKGMRAFSKKLRLSLVFLVTGLFLGNSWLLLRQKPGEAMDYQLQTTHFGLLTDHPDKLPLFDETSGQWLVDGKLERSATAKMFETNPELVPGYTNRKYVAVRLPDNAGAHTVRRALFALLNEGVCRVGIYAGKKVKGPSQTMQAEIDVHVLDWVRDERGQRKKCQSRFG